MNFLICITLQVGKRHNILNFISWIHDDSAFYKLILRLKKNSSFTKSIVKIWIYTCINGTCLMWTFYVLFLSFISFCSILDYFTAFVYIHTHIYIWINISFEGYIYNNLLCYQIYSIQESEGNGFSRQVLFIYTPCNTHFNALFCSYNTTQDHTETACSHFAFAPFRLFIMQSDNSKRRYSENKKWNYFAFSLSYLRISAM